VNSSKRITIYYLENRRKVVPMVLKLKCPECGKGEESDLIEVLADRKYRMKCRDCGCTYILTASVDEGRKCNESSKEGS
jgi:ribosomal protein S27AE